MSLYCLSVPVCHRRVVMDSNYGGKDTAFFLKDKVYLKKKEDPTGGMLRDTARIAQRQRKGSGITYQSPTNNLLSQGRGKEIES